MNETPVKHLRVGDEVLVLGYEVQGSRHIAELYDQAEIPGGVILDQPILDGIPFRSWNEDVLEKIE